MHLCSNARGALLIYYIYGNNARGALLHKCIGSIWYGTSSVAAPKICQYFAKISALRIESPQYLKFRQKL